MIKNASTSVDLVMYEFDDSKIESALVAAKARGVNVRIILSSGYQGGSLKVNQKAYDFFQANNVPVLWSPSYFALTHQKTLVIDGKQALIMTFNFTQQYYATARDFGILDSDASDVADIQATFNADWQGNQIDAPAGDDLVWSPGAEDPIIDLIESAYTTLDIYNEEMADTDVINALAAAARRGVAVNIDMTYSSEWKKAFKSLTIAGAHIRTFAASASLYIHAKIIIADGGTAFVGSQNFSATSLNDNRELGIMISNSSTITVLTKTFNSDWQSATPF
jgi:cardiolipin synthase